MKTGGLRVLGLLFMLAAVACGGDDDDDDDAVDAAAAIDAVAPDAGCATAFTIFVNRNGGTYTPGPNDSSANISSVISEEVTFTAHEPPFGHWEATMDCVRAMYAPYDVRITDQDPGAALHMEIIVAAEGSESIGIANVPSISPFSCDVIDGAIGFVFVGEIGTNNATVICRNIGWVGAKLFALDNSFMCPDVSSTLACPGEDRVFVDADAECGEVEARECSCGGTTQNTHQLMLERAGAAQCE